MEYHASFMLWFKNTNLVRLSVAIEHLRFEVE
jgi:hypothetical protein